MINTRKDSWKRGASRSTAKRRPVGGGERFRPASLTPPAASKGELCWTVSTLCVLDGRNIFPYTLLHYCCCLLYRSQYSYFSSSYAFAFTGYGPPDAEGSVHTVKAVSIRVLYRANWRYWQPKLALTAGNNSNPPLPGTTASCRILLSNEVTGELKYPEDKGLRAEPHQGHPCTGILIWERYSPATTVDTLPNGGVWAH